MSRTKAIDGEKCRRQFRRTYFNIGAAALAPLSGWRAALVEPQPAARRGDQRFAVPLASQSAQCIIAHYYLLRFGIYWLRHDHGGLVT